MFNIVIALSHFRVFWCVRILIETIVTNILVQGQMKPEQYFRIKSDF